MALLAYFKKSKPSKDILPSPTGPLSLTIQSSCIEAANKRVAEELKRTSEASAAESGAKSTKRGMRDFYREWIMAVGILLRTGQSFSNVGRPYSHINMIASYTRLNLKAFECHRQLLQE